MHIVIRVERIYGKHTYYPVCEKAKLFAKLARTTSLTHEAILTIEDLGYEIKAAPVELPYSKRPELADIAKDVMRGTACSHITKEQYDAMKGAL